MAVVVYRSNDASNDGLFACYTPLPFTIHTPFPGHLADARYKTAHSVPFLSQELTSCVSVNIL